MLKSAISMVLVGIATILFADTPTHVRRRPMHPKSRPSGGLVEKSYSGNIFRVLNFQNDYPDEKVSALTTEIRRRSLLPIENRKELIKSGNWLNVVVSLVSQEGIGAGALVINDNDLPVELLSPDGRWGILNVTPLKADNPSDEVFEKRFIKAYWGIIARTLGAGTSSFPGCVLVPFSNLKQLDAIAATQPCPEPFNKMIDTGKAYGIGTLTITTYRTACEQGWASQPTNDVQKLIWNEVHAMPTEPLKIKPETKKQEK